MLLLFSVLVLPFVLMADPMILYKTSATNAVCNDGSRAGYYLRPGRADTWIVHLQGGGFCFSEVSCSSRWKNAKWLMSSDGYSSARNGSGILSSDPVENKYLHDATAVFIPYCSSDSFSGYTIQSDLPSAWSFMGSAIVEGVFSDLMKTGLANANLLIFSGSSAGAEGLLPNADKVSKIISPSTQLQLLIDSGWFLDFDPYRKQSCNSLEACTEQDALMMGVPHWKPRLNDRCAAHYSKPSDKWKCMLGYHAYPFLEPPSFVFVYQFDAAGLGHDGMGFPKTSAELAYAQQAVVNLTISFQNTGVRTLYFPSCYSHTIIENPKWNNLVVQGSSVAEAFNDWSHDPSSGFALGDTCNRPNCNPTCSKI